MDAVRKYVYTATLLFKTVLDKVSKRFPIASTNWNKTNSDLVSYDKMARNQDNFDQT